MLSIRAENMGDAVVLRCVGRIVAGDPTRALREAVMCQVGKRLVVLDLADTIDAAGLGNFIFLKTLACVAGMEFKLRVSGAEKRSHLRQESSLATRHSSFEGVVRVSPLRLLRRRNWLQVLRALGLAECRNVLFLAQAVASHVH